MRRRHEAASRQFARGAAAAGRPQFIFAFTRPASGAQHDGCQDDCAHGRMPGLRDHAGCRHARSRLLGRTASSRRTYARWRAPGVASGWTPSGIRPMSGSASRLFIVMCGFVSNVVARPIGPGSSMVPGGPFRWFQLGYATASAASMALNSAGSSTAPGLRRAALATAMMYALGDTPANLAHSTNV